MSSSNGALASFADDTGEHVAFIGTDLDLHQLYSSWGGDWVDQDLTAGTGAVKADGVCGVSQIVSFVSYAGEQAYYVDPGGNIQQLSIRFGGNWSNQNLTRTAHARAALAGCPFQ